jgi:hypothetical protein
LLYHGPWYDQIRNGKNSFVQTDSPTHLTSALTDNIWRISLGIHENC